MALIWLVESLLALLFLVFLFFLVTGFILMMCLPFISTEDYTSDIHLSNNNTTDFTAISTNIKAKGTTKMRWAKRSHRVSDDSFANAVMWGDLGND